MRRPGAQSFIIAGAPGTGRGAMARQMAKALLCEAGADAACGVCARCRAFDAGSNADLILAGNGEKPAVVDDIRGLREEALVRPYYSAHKVFIIERAGDMTEQAQNALLKILEEPPSYAVFFLLAESEARLLRTVRSRCVVYRTRPADRQTVLAALAGRGVDRERAAVCAVFARGSVGAAIALAESETFMETRAEMARFAERGQSAVAALELSKRLSERKEQAGDALSALELWYRDALAYKAGGAAAVWQTDFSGRIAVYAAQTDAERAAANFKAVEAARERIRHSANLRLALDVLLLELCEPGFSEP